MSSTPVKPTRGKYSRGVKLLISTVYLLTPISLMVYKFWTGEPLQPLLLLIVILLIFASAYTIYGEATVDKATDAAQDITSSSEDSSNEGKE